MVRPNGMATHFDKARRVRSFDDVVEQLREAIYSGRIRPGERLPGERQLSEEFGVGRPTLREALRSLEAVGIIEVRPGKSGGSYAVTPSESTVGDALAALVHLRGASLEDLTEFRRRLRGRERRLGRAARRRARPVRARGARRGGARGGGGGRLARRGASSTSAGTRRSRGRPRTACGSGSRSASTRPCCAAIAPRSPPTSAHARSPTRSTRSPARWPRATPTARGG